MEYFTCLSENILFKKFFFFCFLPHFCFCCHWFVWVSVFLLRGGLWECAWPRNSVKTFWPGPGMLAACQHPWISSIKKFLRRGILQSLIGRLSLAAKVPAAVRGQFQAHRSHSGGSVFRRCSLPQPCLAFPCPEALWFGKLHVPLGSGREATPGWRRRSGDLIACQADLQPLLLSYFLKGFRCLQILNFSGVVGCKSACASSASCWMQLGFSSPGSAKSRTEVNPSAFRLPKCGGHFSSAV